VERVARDYHPREAQPSEEEIVTASRSRNVALVVAAVAIAAFAAVSASAGGKREHQSFTLIVGTTLSVTGDGSVFGPAFQKHADFAAVVANRALRAAGVAGVQVQIAHADDGTRPDQAVNAARKLIGDGADCLAGSIQSANTIAIANGAAIPGGVPLISPASTSVLLTDLVDNGLVFRIPPSDTLQGPVLAAAIRQEIGADKTLSFAARNDAFGAGLVRATAEAWQRLGGKQTGSPILYDPGAANYDSEAQRIVAGNPDAFVILDFPQTYARVGASLLRTGRFDANKLFVGGGQPSTIPSFVPHESMEGARGTRPAVPLGATLTKTYDAQLVAAVGAFQRQSLDVNEFDAVMTCTLAAVSANSGTGRDIARHLRRVASPPGEKYTYLQLTQAIRALRAGRDIDYQGIAGPIDWDANGDPAAATYDFYKYVGGTLTTQRQYRNLGGRILRLDLTPPTAPRVTGRRAQGRRVTFSLRSTDPGNVSPPVTFRCAFDNERLRACSRTVTARLRPGRHLLRAVAEDAQDNRSKTTFFRFRVTA
jgi:branched-chain amino acid transport system substrate-binding protein